MAIYRSNQHSIQVTATGVSLDAVSWDFAEGGEIDPEMETYHPGAMGESIAVGGLRKRGPLTVRRAWSDALIGQYIALDNVSGDGPCAVTITPLKADRKTSGAKGITYTGIVGKVTRPTADASDSKTVFLELVMSCNEHINQ